MSIEKLNEFIESLKATSSRLEKERILATATNFQKQVLEFVYNPYKPTGIGKKKLEKFVELSPKGYDLPFMLVYLQSHNTGSDLDIGLVKRIARESGYKDLVYAIACKDLKIGVNATTLNKVFGKGFIPTFEVQLAERYMDNPDKYLTGKEDFTITEKLDGVRCVLMFDDDGNPQFYARSGRRIEGLVELEEEALEWGKFCGNSVFDGELLASGEGESNSLYRKTMSIVGSDADRKTGIIFNVFDVAVKKEFMQGRCDEPYWRRHCALFIMDDTEHIKKVRPLYRGRDKSEVDEWLAWAHREHKEGVMINIDSAPYICGRNSGLLKVKTFKECEVFIRSIERGTGRNSDRLGAVIVDMKDKNGVLHTVRVGSGFTDTQRDYYFNHKEELIGKVAEVGYFEVTKNIADDSLSLRFPTWLDRIREDKDLESMAAVD